MSQEIDFRQLGEILSRRRRMILTTAAVCLGLAIVVNVVMRPIYQASVTIEVRKQPTRSSLTGEAIAADQYQSDNMEVFTAAELVTNQSLLSEVVQRLKERGLLQMPAPLLPFLKHKPKAPPGVTGAAAIAAAIAAEELDQEVDWLNKITTVQPVRDTRLFTIQVEHWNPETAMGIANVLADTYVTTKERWLASADSSRAGQMSQQMRDARVRMDKLEASLNSSGSKAPVILTEQLKQLTDAISGLNESYVKVQTDRLAAGARLARARAALKDSLADLGDLPLQSETLDGLWRELLACQTELAKSREVFKEGHPKIKILVSQLHTIRENIHAELAKTIASLQQEHAVLLEREKNLRSTITDREAKLHQVSDELTQQTAVQSDLQSSRELYTVLSTRAQEDQASGAVRYPLAQVIGSATVGSKPIRPIWPLNMALGLMVGLMGGAGTALLQEYLRQVIRTPIDAAEQLELPVLGMIPRRL